MYFHVHQPYTSNTMFQGSEIINSYREFPLWFMHFSMCSDSAHDPYTSYEKFEPSGIPLHTANTNNMLPTEQLKFATSAFTRGHTSRLTAARLAGRQTAQSRNKWVSVVQQWSKPLNEKVFVFNFSGSLQIIVAKLEDNGWSLNLGYSFDCRNACSVVGCLPSSQSWSLQ